MSPYLATFPPEKKIIRMQMNSLTQTNTNKYLLCSCHFIGLKLKCQYLHLIKRETIIQRLPALSS
jgi:hypothetical protein